MVVARRPYVALALLLAVALGLWLWFGLTRSIGQDEGISVLAAQGILQHGVPILPSGYLYHRGYVQHYMLAGTIGAFGLTDISIMLPSLLMALATLWLVYLSARDILGRPWVGVAAVALLIAVQMQASYATSPRFYMALQFFTILASYGAWRGYVQGDVRFKIVTFLAIVAAILNHREGVALVIAIPLSVVIVGWMTNRKIPSVPSLLTLGGAILVAATVAFMLLYATPLPVITGYAVVTPGLASLNPDVIGWAAGILEPKRVLLYGMTLLPIALFAGTVALHRRGRDVRSGTVYILVIYAVCSLMLIVSTARVDARLWFFIVPFYSLLAGVGLAATVESFGPRVKRWLDENRVARAAAVSLAAVGAIAILGGGASVLMPQYVELAQSALGPRCVQRTCDKGVKAYYARLSQQLEPGDLIVSSSPHVTNYYIGRVDAYLREKVIIKGEEVTQFEDLTDEYFGIPLIDASDLRDLLGQERRVFVITTPIIMQRSSQETRDFLEQRFQRLNSNRLLTTYVNCIEPPCGPDSG